MIRPATVNTAPSTSHLLVAAAGIALIAAVLHDASPGRIHTANELQASGAAALERLYRLNPHARELARRSVAVMIFPEVARTGVVLVGGQRGDGVLYSNDRPVGYFRIHSDSMGWQAGGQSFSHAMFFFTRSGLNHLRDSKGWSIATGPGVVIVDKGRAASLNATTLKTDVAAIPFGPSGLMTAMGLEDARISEIHPPA